jgi:hypothetical protein
MEKLVVYTPDELSSLIEESLKKVLSERDLHSEEATKLPELLSITQAAEL